MMILQSKIQELQREVEKILKSPTLKQERRVSGECYFIDNQSVVCFEKDFGDARYPYACDGRTLWAYASGNVKVEESIFNIFLLANEGKEPNLCFFAGVKGDKGYTPVSLLGVARQPIEDDIQRYTVFTAEGAYYFTKTSLFISCVFMNMDEKKNLRFVVHLQNIADKSIQTYISAYMNCFLRHAPYEDFEAKWYKRCKQVENGYEFKTTEYVGKNQSIDNYAKVIRSRFNGKIYQTTARRAFVGGMQRQLNCSIPLQKGVIEQEIDYTEFTDNAVAAEIIPLTLNKDECFTISYTICAGENEIACQESAKGSFETDDINITKKPNKDISLFFGGDSNLRTTSLNFFLSFVLQQVEFCSRAKNYAGTYIGIRDIFQQLEASLMWIGDYCKKKMGEALNFIGEDGRAPRQYSYPANKNILPKMDLRPFIDQGVWIISTIYTYLAFTNDYDFLNQECGYYKLFGKGFENDLDFSNERDSVFDHMIRITDYLLSKIDNNTSCLRALYGDWNDALDGLGTTTDVNKDFGSGVSVMATLQLYKNLSEMLDIIDKTGKHTEKVELYKTQRQNIRKGLLTYAIVNRDEKRKILHGWGDKREYFIGSFKDNDGENRDSLTSNAFWVLSGMLDCDKTLKKDILRVYDNLDSKYGIKTFEPYFSLENKKVGRINRLPKGTAENGATYIHATLFAIWSLFEMGEAKRAWEQLEKILPITHKFISTTPFVMPNSYAFNEEKGFDGESMSDWFTGSGCVLIKSLVWGAFGILPDLNGVLVAPANFFPTTQAELTVNVKGCSLSLRYLNKGIGKRSYLVNGIKKQSIYDEKRQTQTIYFSNDELNSKTLKIEVID